MKLRQLTLCILASTVTLYSEAVEVRAQSYPIVKPLLIAQKFEPKTGGDSKPITTGGATRGSTCIRGQKMLTALLPADKQGLTFTAHPSFFWYMPTTSAQNAEFVIYTYNNQKEEDDTEFYRATLPISANSSGIMGFTLPKNIPGLKVNQAYHWSVTVICDADDNPSVDGFIELTKPDTNLSATLKATDKSMLSFVYAKEGIWYEELSILVELLQTQPPTKIVQQNWQDFLDSVGLNDLVSEHIVNFPEKQS